MTKRLIDPSKLITQRDCMRALIRKHGYNRRQCVKGFIKAYNEGIILRMRNTRDQPFEEYARMVYENAKSQGW